MKQIGIILLGVCLALGTSCSKDEDEAPVKKNEPDVPMTSYDMTGIFEGEWNNSLADNPIRGSSMVNDEYIIIDELPIENILNDLINYINLECLIYPERKDQIVDTLGNIFFASSYKYPKTNLEIKYEMDSFSDKYFTTRILSIKNMWSDISTVINIDSESPYPGETIVIGPPEPNTISFSVEADSVPYRIDLVSKDHECDVKFDMNDNPWSAPGMWILQYWFNTYRIYNLQTGQKYDIHLTSPMPLYPDKEDTIQFHFISTEWKGPAEGGYITY